MNPTLKSDRNHPSNPHKAVAEGPHVKNALLGIVVLVALTGNLFAQATNPYPESAYRAARYKPELDEKGVGIEPVDVQRDAVLEKLLTDAGKRYDAIAAKYPGERVRRKVWGYEMLDLFDEPGTTPVVLAVWQIAGQLSSGHDCLPAGCRRSHCVSGAELPEQSRRSARGTGSVAGFKVR